MLRGKFTASLFCTFPFALRRAVLTLPTLPHWREVPVCLSMATSSSQFASDGGQPRPESDSEGSTEAPEQPEAKRMKLCPEIEDTGVVEKVENGAAPQAAKVHRKKCALLLSFSGKDYKGMQRNPGVKTIEEDLIQALYAAEAITEEMRDNLGKLGFQRCARTDKGVSAARQLVSLKMVPENRMVASVNSHLPTEIRVMSLFRTTKGFNSKEWCSARTYEYYVPTYAFADSINDVSHEYRSPPETLLRVDQLLGMYKGTHNFHNFTSGKQPGDPSCMRYIIDFTCGSLHETEGVEYVALRVKGQSFMLHQIRKMIGLVIAVMRGYATDEMIVRSLLKEKVNIPRAPGLYLILDNVHFDRYNRKFGEDGVHQRLEWSAVEERIQEFKERVIYQHIHETELQAAPMAEWLASLNIHDFIDAESVPRLPVASAGGNSEQVEKGDNPPHEEVEKGDSPPHEEVEKGDSPPYEEVEKGDYLPQEQVKKGDNPPHEEVEQ